MTEIIKQLWQAISKQNEILEKNTESIRLLAVIVPQLQARIQNLEEAQYGERKEAPN